MKKHFVELRKRMLQRDILFLLLLTIIGLTLRLWHINYGLPNLYLEDEEFFVQPALRVAEGALDSGWYATPATTLIYPLAILFRVVNVFVNLAHNTSLPVTLNYLDHITIFQTSGRVLAALAGTLMIPLAYVMGLQWNKRVGYISAVLVMSSFYLVEHSHIIRPDIPQTLFMLVSLFGLLKIVQQPTRISWYVLAGLGMGLAVNTKFPGAFLVIPIMYVASTQLGEVQTGITTMRIWAKQWLYTLGSALLISIITGPFLYLKPMSVWAGIQAENRAEHAMHDGFSAIEKLYYYFVSNLHWEVGTLLYILALTSVVLIARWRTHIHGTYVTVLWVHVVSYIAMLSALSLHWERWLIPVLPVLFILAAVMIDYVITKHKPSRIFIICLAVIILAGPALRLFRTMHAFALPNTQDIARDWVVNTVEQGAVIAGEPYTPNLQSSGYAFTRVSNATTKSLDEYKAAGTTYWLASDRVYSYLMAFNDTEDPRFEFTNGIVKPRYRELKRNSYLHHTVSSHPLYTYAQLMESNDLAIFATLDSKLYFGNTIFIFQFKQPDTFGY